MGQEGERVINFRHMSQGLTAELQAKERELIEAIRAENPERVERLKTPDPDLILGRIGITYLSPDRPRGYLRLFPQDFIVEEVLPDGTVIELDSMPEFETGEDQRTLWVDLVKASISGPHAMTDLQDALGLEDGKIGYAGFKDSIAVTSQRLTLRGVTKEAVEAVKHERLFLRPVKYGSGALQPGDLKGNRFTIMVRSSAESSPDSALEEIQQNGFVNFFGPQRFGPRLLSHRLGQHILQNDIDGLLRAYFGEPGPFDIPLFRDVRLAMAETFGEWREMLEVAQNFPFTLRDEIKVLKALANDPLKTRVALSLVKDQVKLWVYAYTSWLINRRFSTMMLAGGGMPAQINLPLSENGPLPEYRELMAQDGTSRYADSLRFYPYLQTSSKTIPSRMLPEGLVWKQTPQGWVVRFSLGKGAYATSCLSHAFRLHENLPIPEWAPLEDIDSLREIGDGNLDAVRARFGSVLARRDKRGEEGEE